MCVPSLMQGDGRGKYSKLLSPTRVLNAFNSGPPLKPLFIYEVVVIM